MCGEMFQFRLRKRHVAPIVFPGLFIDLEDALDIFGSLFLVGAQRFDLHARPSLDRCCHSLDPLRHLRLFAQIGIHIHGFGKTGFFQQPRIIGLGVCIQEHGRGIEAIHQQATLIVDREVEGPQHVVTSFCLVPADSLVQQCPRHLHIVYALKKAKEAGFVVMLGVVAGIGMRRDSAHHLSVFECQKQLGLCILKEGIVLLGEMFFVVPDQIGYPIRVILVKPERKHDKGFNVFWTFHFLDLDHIFILLIWERFISCIYSSSSFFETKKFNTPINKATPNIIPTK